MFCLLCLWVGFVVLNLRFLVNWCNTENIVCFEFAVLCLFGLCFESVVFFGVFVGFRCFW